MKIKVALLDTDKSYISKVTAALLDRYSEKLEVHSFTSAESAISGVMNYGINVLIISTDFKEEFVDKDLRCVLAYFCNSIDVDTIDGKPAISKFQRIDDLYRRILMIYSENSESVVFRDSEESEIILFSSPCGGTGTSSMAVAFAIYAASKGKKPIYINFECFGDTDVFFNAPGFSDMTDIIYALKSKRKNLRIKLEAAIRSDENGVQFLKSPKTSLDIMDVSTDEKLLLLSELRASGLSDLIVIDTDFSMGKDGEELLKYANKIVWVSDGSKSANSKILKATEAQKILSQQTKEQILEKANLVYNKFSSKISTQIHSEYLSELGGAPRYEHASTKDVLKALSTLGIWEKLL